MNQKIIRIDLDGVNSYLLKADDHFLLIDTGGHLILDKDFTNRRELLKNTLKKHGCDSENLKLILLTHGDNDHVCNASYIKNKFHSKIAIHKDDNYLVENPTVNDFMNSFQYSSFIYKAVFKVMKKKIYEAAVKTVNDYEPFKPDILIDEYFCLSDYGFEGQIIHIPGHTPGSIGILTKDRDLIAGDTFSNLKKPEIAKNALDFKLLTDSINNLKSYEINMVYPGHGEPFAFKF